MKHTCYTINRNQQCSFPIIVGTFMKYYSFLHLLSIKCICFWDIICFAIWYISLRIPVLEIVLTTVILCNLFRQYISVKRNAKEKKKIHLLTNGLLPQINLNQSVKKENSSLLSLQFSLNIYCIKVIFISFSDRLRGNIFQQVIKPIAHSFRWFSVWSKQCNWWNTKNVHENSRYRRFIYV